MRGQPGTCSTSIASCRVCSSVKRSEALHCKDTGQMSKASSTLRAADPHAVERDKPPAGSRQSRFRCCKSPFNIRRGLRTQQCALCQRGVAGWECPPRPKHERFQRLVMYEALKVSGMVTAPTAEYMQEPINRFCAKRSKLHCFAAPHSS